MHEYDVALKRILTRRGSALLKMLTGYSEVRWLNVELPKVNNLRVDLLGMLPDGELIHIEFQSRNERWFWLRMAEYLFAIRRRYGKFPRQIVLYVGEKPLRMKNSFSGAGLTFRYDQIDVRKLDGEPLIVSENVSDNVIAVLTALGSNPAVLRRILNQIAACPPEERAEALSELSILAGLRQLTGKLRQEIKKMPITEDIMKNEIIGPAIRKGLAQGISQGLSQGRMEGRIEGRQELLVAQIRKRFGVVSPQTRKRVAAMNPDQLTTAGLRLLDAKRVSELFSE
jgi:predicted transposase YdaD